MISALLAFMGVLLSFKGFELQKQAETREQKSYARTVSLGSLLICMVALLLKE